MKFKDRYKGSAAYLMFTRVQVFGLDYYERIVAMDADMIVIQSLNYLKDINFPGSI